MSYRKVTDILPEKLIKNLQEYIDGEYIYIPKKTANRKPWGENTKIRDRIYARNIEIYGKYRKGTSVGALSEDYFLSPKSIQKIVAKMRPEG